MSAIERIAIAELPDTDEYTSLLDDASRLISSEAYDGHVTPDKIRQGLEAGHTVVAVDESRGVIGVGVLRLMGETEASITGIAVAPEARDNGLGTKIMTKLEEVALTEHVETVYITPTSNNSERLYERLGYRAPNDDTLTMQKNIGAPVLRQT